MAWAGSATYRFRIPVFGVPVPARLTLARATLDYSTPVYVIGQEGISPWGASAGWPDPAANWIWVDSNWAAAAGDGLVLSACPTSIILPSTAQGSFEHLITNSSSAPESVSFYLRADDCASLFLDGRQVLNSYFWGAVYTTTVVLTSGSHKIQINEINIGSSSNPAGVIFSSSVGLHTDASWVTK
jgi:hypothetical protein